LIWNRARVDRRQARTSFFAKKEAKKLFVLRALARARHGPQDQKFFGYFFSKK
jgi:hypothetical protein